jgi:AAA domain-containing protein/UvrD-like helicase family protein
MEQNTLTKKFIDNLKRKQVVYTPSSIVRKENEDFGNGHKRERNHVVYRSKMSLGVIFFRVQNQIPLETNTPPIQEGREGFWKVTKYDYDKRTKKMVDPTPMKLYAKLPSSTTCIIYKGLGYTVSKEKEEENYRRKYKRKMENAEGFVKVQNVASVYSAHFGRSNILRSLNVELGIHKSERMEMLKGSPSHGSKLLEWCRSNKWWGRYMDESHYGLYSRLYPLCSILEQHCGEKKSLLCILQKIPSELFEMVREYENEPGVLCKTAFKVKYSLPEELPPSLVEKFSDRLFYSFRNNFPFTFEEKREKLEQAMERAKISIEMNEVILKNRETTGSTAIKVRESFLQNQGFLGMLQEGSLVKCVRSDKYVMLCDDANDIRRLLGALTSIHRNSSKGTKPKQRATKSNGYILCPCKNRNDLCEEQMQAVDHVHKNWATVITGSPGSGKTECITYLMMRYKNVLVMSRDNVMVSNLKNRVGTNCVYTVDGLVYRKQNGRNKAETLAELDEYEIVIIDECSNLGTRMMGLALLVARKAKRVVFLGDQNQIHPIDPGAPFKQIISAIPKCVFNLKECHRVDKESLRLVHAYKEVLLGDMFECVEYKADMPKDELARATLVHVNVKEGFSYRDVLEEVFSRNEEFSSCSSVDLQILTLNRETVARLNMLVFKLRHTKENYSEALSRFKERRPIILSVGMRVCFRSTQRRSHLKDIGIVNYEVSNGEISTVVSIDDIFLSPNRKKIVNAKRIQCVAADNKDELRLRIITLDSGKTVVLCREKGFNPSFLDYGWAATVDSMQGGEANTVMFVHAGEEVRGKNWSVSHLYVAVSRARKRLWIVGDMDDFENLAQSVPYARKTDLESQIKKKSCLVDWEQDAVSRGTFSSSSYIGISSFKKEQAQETSLSNFSENKRNTEVFKVETKKKNISQQGDLPSFMETSGDATPDLSGFCEEITEGKLDSCMKLESKHVLDKREREKKKLDAIFQDNTRRKKKPKKEPTFFMD